VCSLCTGDGQRRREPEEQCGTVQTVMASDFMVAGADCGAGGRACHLSNVEGDGDEADRAREAVL
jgi:hypothetical protein